VNGLIGLRSRPPAVRLAFVALVISASCATSSAGPSGSDGDVRIHGILTRLELASCDSLKPDAASRITITFEDDQGEVVGKTTSGETTLTPSSGYCAATAPYSVEVRPADAYVASAPGMRSPERMTLEELERASFAWDLGAEIQVNE
jgi:hypothetical protein